MVDKADTRLYDGVSTQHAIDRPPGWIRRPAKLFEAGDYPDKGVTVTAAQIQNLVAAFRQPVPILIEHASSPLEIGFLTDVEAREGELHGTLSLSPEANQLIERSRAYGLSLGLSRDLAAIEEVSLVQHPRVPGAQLFRGEQLLAFSGELDAWQPPLSGWSRRTVERFLAEGQLIPAQARLAEALLEMSSTVQFSGRDERIGDLVESLISLIPRGEWFHQTPTPPPTETTLESSEAEFYRRHFPDLALEEIAKRRGAKRMD